MTAFLNLQWRSPKNCGEAIVSIISEKLMRDLESKTGSLSPDKITIVLMVWIARLMSLKSRKLTVHNGLLTVEDSLIV